MSNNEYYDNRFQDMKTATQGLDAGNKIGDIFDHAVAESDTNGPDAITTTLANLTAAARRQK